jgi:hypothetical protein
MFGKKTETAAIREPSTCGTLPGRRLMTAERLHSRALVPHGTLSPDRRLRNRIIIANAVAWIAIVILICLLVF